MPANFNFKKVAQAETSLSPIMVGRKKIDSEEVVGKKLTVDGFDFADKFDKSGNRIVNDNGEIDQFGVLTFSEYPDSYYCCGTVFTKVCKAWAAGYGGDADAASTALKEYGGVPVIFRESKTKAGNNLISVEIV